MQVADKHIPLSKQKLVFLLLGCGVFLAMGIWLQFLAAHPPSTGRMLLRNPFFLRSIGIIAIVFFGSIAFLLFKKLHDKTPGLSITNMGIFDNSGALSVGFIPWSDVVEIQEARVYNQVFVNVVVKNPEEYLARQKNLFKRTMMRINYKSYGSVIGISANGLKSSAMEVKYLIEERFEEYTSNFQN